MARLIELFLVFLKIGSFTFGGGYAMIPLIKKELVDKKKWLDLEVFTDTMAIAQAAPGAVAVNVATYLGYLIAGVRGAFVAASAATLPSIIILICVAAFFSAYETNPVVIAFFKGVRPAIVALIVSAAYSMGGTILKSTLCLGMAVLALICLIAFKLHPILVISLGGVGGYIIYLYHKSREVEKNVS